jgi:hypothetical protein
MNIRNSYDSNAEKLIMNAYVSSPNLRGSAMSSLDTRESQSKKTNFVEKSRGSV